MTSVLFKKNKKSLFNICVVFGTLLFANSCFAEESDICARSKFLSKFGMQLFKIAKAEDYFTINDDDVKIRGRLEGKVKCEVTVKYYDLPCFRSFIDKLKNLAEFYPNVYNSWKVQRLAGAASAGASSSMAGRFVYIVGASGEIEKIETQNSDMNALNAQVFMSAAACSFGKENEETFTQRMKDYSGADGIQ